MATFESPVKFANQILDTSPFGQQALARMVRGCELLMESMMNVAIQQIEVTQSLITGEIADLELLTRITTPAALIEVQLEVARRRSERVVNATRRITEEMNRSWAEAITLIQPKTNPDAGR